MGPGARRRRPAIVPTLAAIAMLALLVSLGQWQLGRAAEKRALLERYATRAGEPPLHLAPDLAPDDPRIVDALPFRTVTLQGTFLTDRQYLLDNRTHQGVAGYHVLTPLRRGDSATLVLVDRGWIPVGKSREHLPDVGVADAPTRLTATLSEPPRPGLLLGETGYEQGTWPRVVQYLDIGLISAQLQAPVLPLVARLDPGAPFGYVRDWKPYYGISPERHVGYAVQWFALALALVVIYFYLTLRKRDGHDAE